MNQQYIEKTNELYKLAAETQTEMIKIWLEHVIFTPLWWLGITLSVIPWIIWLCFSKKESRDRLLYAGFTIMLISSFFDFLGVQLGLWIYYYEIIPWIPAYEPWDWTLMPVIFMIFIEYKPNSSPYIKGFIFAVLAALIGEPLFKYIGLYKALHWNSFFSFPIYFLFFLMGYWFTRKQHFSYYWSS
ncbi:CBO0543 family protein [Halalkalibacter alkalisediminis]|uniref:CBO0543 family protein n=1 Tax=Halalkalibacter alkalisediminis TaxID=935616 RepID=A0ABV6NMH3_9BACI|nr:CBO0543 family protein [Halalkalibacter alkalisediminis]